MHVLDGAGGKLRAFVGNPVATYPVVFLNPRDECEFLTTADRGLKSLERSALNEMFIERMSRMKPNLRSTSGIANGYGKVSVLVGIRWIAKNDPVQAAAVFHLN